MPSIYVSILNSGGESDGPSLCPSTLMGRSCVPHMEAGQSSGAWCEEKLTGMEERMANSVRDVCCKRIAC